MKQKAVDWWKKEQKGHSHLLFYALVSIVVSVITTIAMNALVFFPMLLNSAFQ
jgi:hypothetical protein